MSLFSLYNILFITWLFSLPLASNDCPNEAFKIVAKHDQPFKLNQKHIQRNIRYWVAFGSKGKWVINLVDSSVHGAGQLYFYCNKRYFPSFQKIDDDNPPLCCVALHSIDHVEPRQPPPDPHAPPHPLLQSHPFAILPDADYEALTAKHSTPGRISQSAAEGKFYWMQRVKMKGSNEVTASMLWPIKIAHTEYGKLKSIFDLGVEFKTKDAEADACFVSDLFQECDTGINNDIVVFQVECSKYSFIRFGFSSDGIFKIAEFLDCNDALISSSFWKRKSTQSVNAATEIKYYPISKLYPLTQEPPSYNSVELGWKLGAFCGSCPSTSFKLTISESEAQSNKKRLQHALGITATTSAALPHLSPTLKYTRTWYKEAAVTIASGRATTIAATCNGLDLWEWAVSIGSWGEGSTVVPTQFFYCTDRNTPPVCKPRITAAMDNSYGLLCCGQDQNSDFDASANPDCNTPKWQTPHGGRPTPIRLQGQRDGEGPLKVEQQAGRAAARIDYIDRLDEEDGTNDKGLFVASVTYDGDDDSDMGAQNAYIPSYSLYNGDFLSTTDNTNVFIPFIIVLFVLCALCIAVIACIGVVGCFAFRKHTSIQKNTVRLNKVTPYKV
eukprot:973816_1